MSLTAQDIESPIQQFIQESFPDVEQRSLDDTKALLASEIVDSLGIIKIITFIEEEFDIMVEDEDILPKNFQSISAIVNLVQQKL